MYGFDWDEGNTQKCQKHGVSIAEIEDLFLSGHLTMKDKSHSVEEQRFWAIGKSSKDRMSLLFLLFERKIV